MSTTNRQNISLARLKKKINYDWITVPPSDIMCLSKNLVLSRPEGRANTLCQHGCVTCGKNTYPAGTGQATVSWSLFFWGPWPNPAHLCEDTPWPGILSLPISIGPTNTPHAAMLFPALPSGRSSFQLLAMRLPIAARPEVNWYKFLPFGY